MRFSRSIVWLLLLLSASCATDADKKPQPEPPKGLTERLNQKNGYKQDANGNWVPLNDKRSSFESKGQSQYGKGEFSGKQYQTQDYSKKSWWGNKDYGRQSYAGNTDGSHFQKNSDLGSRAANEGGSRAKIPGTYNTGNYSTTSAREANRNFAKPGNAESSIPTSGLTEPEIIDWKEARSLSLEQSKGILGR